MVFALPMLLCGSKAALACVHASTWFKVDRQCVRWPSRSLCVSGLRGSGGWRRRQQCRERTSQALNAARSRPRQHTFCARPPAQPASDSLCTQRCSASEADLLLLCGPAFTAATSSHEKQENVECLLAFFHFHRNTFFVFRAGCRELVWYPAQAAGRRRVCAVTCAPPQSPASHPPPPTLPGLLSAHLRRRNSVSCG
jgi:hypothetical protein